MIKERNKRIEKFVDHNYFDNFIYDFIDNLFFIYG